MARNETLLKIKDLFTGLPAGYKERAAAMTALDQAFHREMAMQIQAALKEEMLKMAHTTYEDKKHLSKWVNGELRRYGLALSGKVKDVTTNKTAHSYPAILAADVGHHPTEGRFRLLCKTDSNKPIFPLTTQDLSVLLEHLEIIADDPERRRWGKWTEHTR